MTDCHLCKQPCLEGQDLRHGSTHQTCSSEWHARTENFMCEKCGENPQVESKDGEEELYSCSGCLENDNGFQGYPGA